MDKASAVNLIVNTFESSFDKGKFATFTKNLLKTYDDTRAFSRSGAYVKDAFKHIVSHYDRLGVYTDPDGKRIDILVVYLQRTNSLYNARTAQRNFLRWYIKDGNNASDKDAVLAAIVSPDKDDWRFSLVKMELGLGLTISGSISAIEELTPAKRYSFIVGANEHSHTAKQSLLPLLERPDANLTLADIEDAFNIETITKEFFEKYKELFLDVKECLDALVKKDTAIKADFSAKGVDTSDFAKKLLGQIVFLYFLQKKGWFGVPRGAQWGDGPKGYIRSLFSRKDGYSNFFNDILEPLFYEALAVDRTDDFYSRFDCKIPFLNGGLFDPINGYDWINTDIIIPNELFSNKNKTKEGDEGDGILDIFDRYNFTVCEDEPLEKEVAVDPEMLGKVFENLLEVKDRKSKGTYYTPREIVHYMCQESLINHLSAELPSIDKAALELLVKQGEVAIENDVAAAQCEKNGTTTYKYKLDEIIRKNAKDIDTKLKSIKVCDPAVGSGAFLVGMMNEIVRTRLALASYREVYPKVYDLKRNAIQNSLYGVDIDPGAVEIAKLRLWLSLVVDEEDRSTIQPLPNLDYKIMQGNSLLEDYEGIKLFDDSILQSTSTSVGEEIEFLKEQQSRIGKEYCDLRISDKPDKVKQTDLENQLKSIASRLKKLESSQPDGNGQSGLFDKVSAAKAKADELKQKHRDYFNASLKRKKDELKQQIQTLEWELIEATLIEQEKAAALDRIRSLKDSNVRPFFLWRLHFSEVFEHRDGFDLVLANPPYVDSEEMTRSMPEERKRIGEHYAAAKGNWDLYIPFWELGHNLLTSTGTAVFITPNKWLSIKYGERLRELLEPHVVCIANCDKVNVFEAGNSPVVVLASKAPADGEIRIDVFDADYAIPCMYKSSRSVLNTGNWGFLLSEHIDLLLRIAQSGNRVSSKYVAENPFTVGEAYEVADIIYDLGNPSLYDDEKQFKFINTGTIDKFIALWGVKTTTYLKTKYRCPVISRTALKQALPKRFQQMDCTKIVISGMRHFECLLDEASEVVAGKSTVILKSNDDSSLRGILGILNSKLISFYIKESFGALGIDGGINFTADLVESLPLPDSIDTALGDVATVVDDIQKLISSTGLMAKDSMKVELEGYQSKLDAIVYRLYRLTPDDVSLIQSS